MLKRFNSGVQRYCAANIDRCFTGDAPSLRQVRKAYGGDVLDSWLDIQLTDLVNFCGVKGKEEFSSLRRCRCFSNIEPTDWHASNATVKKPRS